jgi:hypothetical protein
MYNTSQEEKQRKEGVELESCTRPKQVNGRNPQFHHVYFLDRVGKILSKNAHLTAWRNGARKHIQYFTECIMCKNEEIQSSIFRSISS